MYHFKSVFTIQQYIAVNKHIKTQLNSEMNLKNVNNVQKKTVCTFCNDTGIHQCNECRHEFVYCYKCHSTGIIECDKCKKKLVQFKK